MELTDTNRSRASPEYVGESRERHSLLVSKVQQYLQLDTSLVTTAEGTHAYPSRTRPLRPPAPRILGTRVPGKVGRCQASEKGLSRDAGLFLLLVLILLWLLVLVIHLLWRATARSFYVFVLAWSLVLPFGFGSSTVFPECRRKRKVTKVFIGVRDKSVRGTRTRDKNKHESEEQRADVEGRPAACPWHMKVKCCYRDLLRTE